jgi:cobalt-zinc-cadmium efflux system membrane fusion protein
LLGRPPWSNSILAVVGLFAATALILIAAAAWWLASGTFSATDATGTGGVSTTTPASENEVRLSTAKLAAANLHTSEVRLRTLQESRRVPGAIGYNTSRRLEVKLPASGVVKQILAQPGQSVQGGDKLALLTSMEVGLARDEVLSAEANAELARKESEWATQIAEHLDELFGALNDRLELKKVEEMFDRKILGTHRDQIVSAYSKLLLAEKTAESTDAAAGDGAIAGLIVRQRRSAREVAAAGFQSVCEESKFKALQEKLRTLADLEHAERQVAMKKRNLAVLLGPFSEISSAGSDDGICELVLRAPVDGVIEERLVADGARFVPSQLLYVIANTSTLRVSAQIYEREWALLNANKVTELVVESPSVPDHQVSAKMLYVSVSVSPTSHAVPLVAEISNAEGRFKPGMFAWVEVPVGEAFEALAVPSSAVTRHEQRPFVFVEARPGVYRKVDVVVGRETPKWIEIKRGLEAGQHVVDAGVFLLKSELLLVGEEP